MSTLPTGTVSPTQVSAPTLLEGTHWIDRLRDGTVVLIRPLRPEDRELEEDFLQAMSPDAKRLRFLCSFREASPELVDQLMDIDYDKRMAFLALGA